jgi:hypothetical protein
MDFDVPDIDEPEQYAGDYDEWPELETLDLAELTNLIYAEDDDDYCDPR